MWWFDAANRNTDETDRTDLSGFILCNLCNSRQKLNKSLPAVVFYLN